MPKKPDSQRMTMRTLQLLRGAWRLITCLISLAGTCACLQPAHALGMRRVHFVVVDQHTREPIGRRQRSY